jgi:membrane-associated phospholipid phosphatase
MNPWLDWGIPAIQWLQGLGSWLVPPMRILSFLGTEPFYLVFMPAVFWCFDSALGFRLGLILLTGEPLNTIFKMSFGWPRPYWVSNHVQALASEASFGIPSGHAQDSMAVWGRMAGDLRRGWAYLLAGILVLGISLSRLVLAVHYPTDVLGGWVIACLLLLAFFRLDEPVRRLLPSWPIAAQIGGAALLSLGLLAIGLVVHYLAAARGVAATWSVAASSAIPGSPPINPLNLEPLISSTGALFGFAAGGACLFNRHGFNAGGPVWLRLQRFIIGVLGMLVIYYGLKFVFPAGQSPLAMALRFLRYAATTYWMVFLAPQLFVRLGAADRSRPG